VDFVILYEFLHCRISTHFKVFTVTYLSTQPVYVIVVNVHISNVNCAVVFVQCFMNSVLQCLSNSRPLLEFCISSSEHEREINHDTSRMKGDLFICKLYFCLVVQQTADEFVFACPLFLVESNSLLNLHSLTPAVM